VTPPNSTDAGTAQDTSAGMVARVNYSREGAGDLLRYIKRGVDADRELRNDRGHRLSDEERERFVRRSEEHEFTRSVVLSVPDHADENPRLSDRQVGRETRRTMDEHLADAPTARYVYGIHEDTDHRHAHVALTGAERDLTWDRDDLDRLRERADDRFIERHQDRDRASDGGSLADLLSVVVVLTRADRPGVEEVPHGIGTDTHRVRFEEGGQDGGLALDRERAEPGLVLLVELCIEPGESSRRDRTDSFGDDRERIVAVRAVAVHCWPSPSLSVASKPVRWRTASRRGASS
jgi:hypothetical protein